MIKFLRNPKVRLGLFLLFSIIMAIGFFGNLPGSEVSTEDLVNKKAASDAAIAKLNAANAAATADPSNPAALLAANDAQKVAEAGAAGNLIKSAINLAANLAATDKSTFFIATLSPMAAGFALTPFIFCILGICHSLNGIYKQSIKRGLEKAINRYEVIADEKEKLNTEYVTEYTKLEGLNKLGTSNTLSDQANKNDLAEIKKFINDETTTIEAESTIVKIAGGHSPSKYTYEELLDLYDGAKETAVELKKLKAEINAYKKLEEMDLRNRMSAGMLWGGIEDEVKGKIQDQGIRIKVVTKLSSSNLSKSI